VPVGAPDYMTNVRLVEQPKALLTMPHWFTQLAMDKEWFVGLWVPAGAAETEWVYIVPEGRRLYISDVTFTSEVKGAFYLRRSGVNIHNAMLGPYSACPMSFHKPKRYEEGDGVVCIVYNKDTVGGYMWQILGGWETPASPKPPTPRAKTASEAFKAGLFNHAALNLRPDGVLEVEVSGVELARTYMFKVRNLYRRNEEILEDEPVEIVKFPRRLV